MGLVRRFLRFMFRMCAISGAMSTPGGATWVYSDEGQAALQSYKRPDALDEEYRALCEAAIKDRDAAKNTDPARDIGTAQDIGDET